ncbi:MAG: hypothetical protein RL527_1199 [Planctomycetota bacterium]|jgi:heptosyltransferase-2
MNQTVSRHILVVMPTWMGDCVMATPAIRAMRAERPASTIVLAMHRSFWPLFEGSGLTTTGALPASLGSAWRGRHRVDGTDALLLPNSPGSAFRARLSWPGARLVGWSSMGRTGVLHQAIPRTHRVGSVPTVKHYASLVEAWLGASVTDFQVRLEITPADHAAAAEVLARQGGDASRIVMLNPGASKPSKRWPADHFVTVGRRMAERGALVCVSGSPAELELCASIAAGIPRAIDLAKAGAGLRGLKGLLARARLLVTNDTGTRHVAAALGCPYVCIYGPVDPVVSRLEGARGTDLVPPDGACTSISVDNVITAAEAWMSQPALS